VLRIVLFRRAEPIVATNDGLCLLRDHAGMGGGKVRLTRRGNIVVAALMVAGFIMVSYFESVGV
jgi:hypothetical protein